MMEEKIINFFEKCARNKSIDIDQKIDDMGFANSLFLMQLVLFLEREFNIEVNDADLGKEHFSTVRSITKYVKEKINNKDE